MSADAALGFDHINDSTYIPRETVPDMRKNVSLIIKVALMVVYVSILVSGNHPPIFAQRSAPQQSVEDALQDDRILQLNNHIDSTDAKVQRQYEATAKNRDDIALVRDDLAGIQGEERAIGALLGIMTLASLVLQSAKFKRGA